MSSAFDIIFAGGGTTACVIAGRLAAADPTLKILIVESGQHSRDLPVHFQPGRFIENLAPTSTTVTFYVAKPNKDLNGRTVVTACGRTVGGASTINGMAYVRGAASDYDDWAKFGNEGWSFADLLPLFKKIETFSPKTGLPTHGYAGPMQISAGQPNLGFGEQFLKVGREYDPHRPQVDDNNDFVTPNGYSSFYKYIDPKTGRRSDPATQYLYPHSGNANLQILVGKHVKRIIIENGRAVGVEYTSDPASGASGELFTVKASKLVVVSAGTFGSPAILERSGIGATSVLEKNKVPVVVDLPGVGENYKDHISGSQVYYASDESETMDDVWSDPEAFSAQLKKWESNGTGKIAHNACEALVKVRPTAAELASIGPAFRSRWETYFQHSVDKPIAIIAPFSGFMGDHSAFLGKKFITMVYLILYPESTGSLHISSGDDVNAPLDFDVFSALGLGDVASLTMLYKKTRELARRLPGYRGEAAFCHPVFPADSLAVPRETDGPVSISAPDIVYSVEDDKAIEVFHRNILQMLWHSLGTCAMKPREQGGVVDACLNVHGVDGLKVADMSICPSNVGNNTFSTALMIGEKAAVLIAQDLGISLD